MQVFAGNMPMKQYEQAVRTPIQNSVTPSVTQPRLHNTADGREHCSHGILSSTDRLSLLSSRALHQPVATTIKRHYLFAIVIIIAHRVLRRL